jgi:1-acyl-sn-glycerol-3-phosphate acyltransferase
MRAMREVLRNDEGLVIFPEGTYYQGTVGPGHSGLIRMVRSRAKAPFIPVGIEYSGKRGRTLVKIRLGKPLAEDPAADEGEFLDRAMKEIARLSGLSPPG